MEVIMLKESEDSKQIQLKNIKKSFTTSAGTFDALKGIDLTVGKGEFISVVGKSGSGKTTLMNMISGIDHPSSGEVIIEGNPIQALSQNKLSKWRGSSVGVVFQFFQLLPTLSVLENVMLPMDFGNTFSTGERKDRAMELLKQVGIEDQAYKFPTALSGGQQQRTAIARALANDPPILIADEPTGNLDSSTAQDVFRIFRHLVEQGKTVIIVTHDQDIADQCNRKVILADGQIAYGKAD
jgi:putative ABC transport system ATP-binding protein